MKLRLYVIALLLANALVAVWSMGWLDSVFGTTLRTDREPDRVLQQVNPQAMSVVTEGPESRGPSPNKDQRPPSSRSPASPPTTAPTSPKPADRGALTPSGETSEASTPVAGVTPAAVAGVIPVAVAVAEQAPMTVGVNATQASPAASCLEAGPFNTDQVGMAESKLSSLIPAGWRRVTVEQPASFAVLMGPFPTREALRSKVAELERLKIRFERLAQPNADGSPAANAPTLLVLARGQTREAAASALPGLAQRGVRTARVAQLAPAATVHRLLVEGITEAQGQALKTMGDGVEGKGFAACAT